MGGVGWGWSNLVPRAFSLHWGRGWGVEKGADGTCPTQANPSPTPSPYHYEGSSQSSIFSKCIMADLERQNIAIELRKFRKKLRQIEKLEELERDLTEEEFLKVTDS